MSGELDNLISRVIDGVAGKADWDALEALAASNPSVWRELAVAQRVDQALTGEARRETACAQWVDIRVEEFAGHVTRRRSRLVATWGGWAAAAAVALAFVSQRAPSRPQSGGNQAGILSFENASDALAAYLERGKKDGVVLGELPDKVLVQTRPARDGRGVEVVYLRQIMECARVGDLYRPSSDEAGNLTAVPVKFRRAVPEKRY